MKILSALTAAAVALTGLAAATPAAAQDRVIVRERTVGPRARDTRVVVRERTTVRRAYGYRRPARNCVVRYRHGQRIRTCRNGRY